MAQTLPNMGLRAWNLPGDNFNYTELAANWTKVDNHDHTSGKGVQIPSAGIADSAITVAKVAGSLKPSGSALATDEALRAIGLTASTATAGNDSRLPTQAMRDALAGTAGAPSSTNKFVTNSDSRLTPITPQFYEVHTWAVGGTIVVASGSTDYVLPLYLSLRSNQTAKIAAAYYEIQSGTNANVTLWRKPWGGTDAAIAALSSITVTTTPGAYEPIPTNFTTLASKDRLRLVVNSISGTPINLTFSLVIEHTLS